MGKYSVLMSLYIKEKPEYLDVSIKSMIEQTLKPDEIVIVKDGPITKELQDVLDKYIKEYPNLFNIVGYEENKGLGYALNFGLKHCQNELVARMDTDDISKLSRCEEQVNLFKKYPETDIIGGDISEFIDFENNIVSCRRVPKLDKEIKEYLKIRCPLNHVTVMFKKSSVIKSGGYIDLFWNEDYYLWIRMVEKNCKMANTGTILVNVRVGKDMYQRRGGKKYFESEKFLQDYMLKNNLIKKYTYIKNIVLRFLIQILMPTKIRGWIFRIFAREKKND
mgnify:CR=1 FL=1